MKREIPHKLFHGCFVKILNLQGNINTTNNIIFREVIAHVIDCYANEMKLGGGQGDHDPDDQPMQIGEQSVCHFMFLTTIILHVIR